MKIVIEAKVDYGWIERRDKGCSIVVHFKGQLETGKIYEFKRKLKAKDIDEAVVFLKEQLGLGD